MRAGEIKQALSERFESVIDQPTDDNRLLLTVSVRIIPNQTSSVSSLETRQHLVVLSTFDADAALFLDISAACCPKKHIAPITALKRNGEILEGSLAYDNDMLILRHAVRLSSLDRDTLNQHVKAIATRADAIEYEFSGVDIL